MCFFVCAVREVVCVVSKETNDLTPLWTHLEPLCDQEWTELHLQGVANTIQSHIINNETYKKLVA